MTPAGARGTGGDTRDGRLPAEFPPMTEPVWSQRLDSPYDEAATPVLAAGLALVAVSTRDTAGGPSDRPCAVLALDRGDGTPRWRVERSPWQESGYPVLATDDDLVVAGWAHELVGIDSATGEQRWSYPWSNGRITAVAVVGRAVVACGGSTIRVLDRDGRPRREQHYLRLQPITVVGGPAGDFLLTTFSGLAARLRRSDLSIRWLHRVPGKWRLPQPVLVHRGVGVVYSYAPTIHAVDLDTGDLLWEATKPAGHLGVAHLLPRGRMVWADERLVCARTNTGRPRWEHEQPVRYVAADPGRVATLTVADDRYRFRLHDPATGRAWHDLDAGAFTGDDPHAPRPRTGFVLADRQLITSHEAGVVTAYPLPDTPDT